MSVKLLQDSLLVLAALKNQLESALRTVKRYIHDDDLKFTVANHILIVVSSFLEEWQRFESLGSDPTVRRTLDIAKPAIERIRRWKGITRLRSSALAHGFRQRDKTLTQLGPLFQAQRAPSAYAEQLLLGELAVYAIATAICQHQVTYDAALSAFYHDGPEKIPTHGIQTMEEFRTEITRIRSMITASDSSLEKCFGSKST